MILYRPIGHRELELLYDGGMHAFPPRLPDQPIFYPVLNAGYAREIAEGWNAKSDTFAGYVTRFTIDNDYVARYERRVVGAARHEELWVPAEELEEFNRHLIGHVEVIAAYFGAGFVGTPLVRQAPSSAKTAEGALHALLATAEFNPVDLRSGVFHNPKGVYCNYAFWKQYDPSRLPTKHPGWVAAVCGQVRLAFQSHYALRLPTDADIFDFEREGLGLPPS